MIDPTSAMIGATLGMIAAGAIVAVVLPRTQPRDKRGRFTKRQA